MKFNEHSRLQGEHAFLSASQYSWVNYSDDKLVDRYKTVKAAALGTRLHALAAEHITLGIRMPRNSATFNAYVNDAIGFRMQPEVVLYFSPNCFGTADTISFDEKKRLLRIHDLKTGVSRTNMKQLEIYAALFCLEYNYKPYELDYELRIYQNDDIMVHKPEPEAILEIMDLIKHFDNIIEKVKADL